MDFKINEEFCGRTVKDFVYAFLHISSSQLTALKKSECGIVLNGNRVTVRAVLSIGDILSLETEDSFEEINENIKPVKLDINIIYEDSDIIAVNKSAGMPTHTSHGHYEDTLANALSYYYCEKDIPFVFRAVNRLDKDTSGIVLVAKNRLTASKLSKEMSEGKIKKTYTAILTGECSSDSGRIETYIRRRGESIIEREVCDKCDGADYAATEWKTIKRGNGLTVVSASPETGRTHQLRVHFAHIGHPILGDGLYGQADPRIHRQSLHAAYLTFTHPGTSRQMILEAPVPDDMKKIIEQLS